MSHESLMRGSTREERKCEGTKGGVKKSEGRLGEEETSGFFCAGGMTSSRSPRGYRREEYEEGDI